MGAQGRAATMKKIPDITEQALKKALGELERSIRDTKRESRATDERVAPSAPSWRMRWPQPMTGQPDCTGTQGIVKMVKVCAWLLGSFCVVVCDNLKVSGVPSKV